MAAHLPAILLASADPALQTLIARHLEATCRVVRASPANPAAWPTDEADLLLVDQQLLGGGSVEFCRTLRAQTTHPLIMFGPNELSLKLNLLDAGADEYLVAPFNLEELAARIRALLRRANWQLPSTSQAPTSFGELVIDTAQHHLTKNGVAVRLTRTEWALLSFFVEHAGQVLTHRQLLQRVWGPHYGEEHGYLHAYVRRLRCKIEADPAAPRYLVSDSGIGYRFQAATTSAAPSAGPPTGVPLPAPTTVLVGRAAEIAHVLAWLAQPAVRLMSLVGPGGVGKTRLAWEIAGRAQPLFAEGVVVVPLATAPAATDVLPLIAHCLGLADVTGPLLDQLTLVLRDQQRLLILDNFEHVQTVAPLLDTLLQAAPRLKLLVTSRSVLNLAGDHQLPLQTLPCPDPQALPPLAELAALPAVALFAQRAQASCPDWRLTDDNAAAVAEICARLDGLPLALELAAAHSRFLSPAALLRRLDDRLTFLSGSAQNLPPRQQTLRGALDWSYHLLAAPAQRLFVRLSVFSAGWDEAAAVAVCADADHPPEQVVATLAELVNHSLLHYTVTPTPRFSMLQLIHDYAHEQCPPAELAALQARHAAYFVRLSVAAHAALLGAEQAGWLQRLEQEHANLQAALTWARAADPALAWQLGAQLWRFWLARSYATLGRRCLEQITACAADVPLAVRAQVWCGAGVLAVAQDDYHEANRWFRAILQLPDQRALGDVVGYALANQGQIAFWQGEYDRAHTLLDQALAHFEANHDELGQAQTLRYLGMTVLNQDAPAAAATMLAASVQMYRRLGQRSGLGTALSFQGRAALFRGEYAASGATLRESLALFQQLGSAPGMARAQVYLGRVALAQGDRDTATALLSASLTVFAAGGDREGLATALEGLAGVAQAAAQPARTGRLLAAAAALRASISAPVQPADAAYLAALQPGDADDQPVLAGAELVGYALLASPDSGTLAPAPALAR